MRHQELRAARIAQNVPLKRIAEELEVGSSYLSHVEHGRRALTREIVAAYTKHLTLNTVHLPVPDYQSTPDLLSKELLRWFRNIKVYRPIISTRTAEPNTRRRTSNTFATFATKFCESSKQSIKDRTGIALIWTTPQDFFEKGNIIPWRRVLTKVASDNIPLKLFFSPSSNPTFATNELLLMIKEYTRCIQFKEIITIDSVSELNFSHFPIDLFVLSNNFALLDFAGREYSRKNSLMLLAPETQFERTLQGYVERIESYRDRKVLLYFSKSDLTKFFREYLATEELSGPRYLFQCFPGSHTRPPQDYEPGSNWWHYYSDLHVDVDELAALRRRAWDALRRRMRTYPARQICSRQAFEEWALTGRRPGVDLVRESADDRINQLQYMIATLRTNPNFQLAIIDHELGRDLGWADLGDNARNLNWLVQGNDKIIVEGRAPNDYGVLLEYQCIISDKLIADRFRNMFEKTWDQLPPEVTQIDAITEFLQELSVRAGARTKITQS